MAQDHVQWPVFIPKVLNLSVLVPEARLILAEKYDNVRTTFFNFRAEHLLVTATILISSSINTLTTYFANIYYHSSFQNSQLSN
jgi:hypothetical protein